MTATPALPEGTPAMPDTNDHEPVTRSQLEGAIRGVRESITDAVSNGMSELAAALKPARNVRDAPSDELSVFNGSAPTGATALLVPADETRVRVTLIARAAKCWISAQPGQAAGGYVTAELPVDTPVVLDTRAAVYACSTDTGPITVSVFVEQARYHL